MGLLEMIESPSDVKKLKVKQLDELATEIRKKIIETVSENGGHLSSNLGAVDILVALYYVFDFPEDKLIFDVGHQCYAHKILSGRKDKFDTVRKSGGLSGFPNVFESEYDAFGAGHAGNSVSACLGYCAARDARKENYYVVDLVGDASLFNGENLEAFTVSDKKPKNLIIVLNDNGMSISRNDNGMYKFFSKMRTKKSYNRFMSFMSRTIGKSFIGKMLKRFKDFVKITVNHTTAIEALGFKYVGIFDGNNIKELVKIFKNLKYSDKAVVLHLRTKKGKGMPEAEKDAETYHGVGKNLNASVSSFSRKAGETLCDFAATHDDLTAICAGMKDGTGLSDFAEKYPERFFDVGIAEEYAVTFAAGQAKGGLRPVVCVYSTFLQRSFDQIMQDVCIQNLPVIFMVDRAGAVGSDGVTHQGLFDLTYLGALPNMRVLAPKDPEELKNAFEYAYSLNAPVAIRFPNGENDNFANHTPFTENTLWEYEENLCENVVLAVGPRAIKIAYEAKSESGKGVSVVNARSVKPLDEVLLDKLAGKNVITIEENVLSGGFGSRVAEYLSQKEIPAKLTRFAFPDEYVAHAPVEEQLAKAGITPGQVAEKFV